MFVYFLVLGVNSDGTSRSHSRVLRGLGKQSHHVSLLSHTQISYRPRLTSVYLTLHSDVFFWTPQVIGGIGFVIASTILCIEVQPDNVWWKIKPLSLGWQIGYIPPLSISQAKLTIPCDSLVSGTS